MRNALIVTLLILAGFAGGYGSYLIWDHLANEPTAGLGTDTGGAWSGTASNGAEPVAGQPLPSDIVLPDLHGDERNLTEWLGKVVVVNFWASWCPPCIREMPLFEELQQEYSASGFTFIGIAVDNRVDAAEFADKTGVTYPILHGRAEAMAAGDRFGNRRGMLPYTVLIDAEGTIRETWSGELERADLEPVIQAMLAEAGS